MFKKIFLAIVFSIASFSWANIAIAGGHCQGITMSDMKGVSAGAYPQVYELAEFEKAANCTMQFSENPNIALINATIVGNSGLPNVNDRLPEEP